MKNSRNSYIPVLHRMFYISTSSNKSLWLALCLYSPMLFDFPVKCMIVDSSNGQMKEQEKHDGIQILSNREKQILSLINKGLISKEIAQILCVSVNTVSRHRQKILSKLKVKNSIEACRFAKILKLIWFLRCRSNLINRTGFRIFQKHKNLYLPSPFFLRPCKRATNHICVREDFSE